MVYKQTRLQYEWLAALFLIGQNSMAINGGEIFFLMPLDIWTRMKQETVAIF